jgi:hypothetical protein
VKTFASLEDAQRRAEAWCRVKAGMRIHGTIQARPAEVFAMEEAPVLLAAPSERYDVPRWTTAKVARDHHIQVGKALYSVPGELIGTRVTVRVDSALVKILHRGQVIKIHPALPPGGRSTDEADLPSEVTAYALRDIDKLMSAWPPGTATRSGPTPRRCWTAPCPGPEDAVRLPAPGAGQAVRCRPGRGRLCPGVGVRSHRRRVDRAGS